MDLHKNKNFNYLPAAVGLATGLLCSSGAASWLSSVSTTGPGSSEKDEQITPVAPAKPKVTCF